MSEDTKRIEGRVDALHIKFDAVIEELNSWKMTSAERLVRLEEQSGQNKMDIDQAHEKLRTCEKVCQSINATSAVTGWIQKAAVIAVPILMYLNLR